MTTLKFWKRVWHRITGHTYHTNDWAEPCHVCGVRQGDWIVFMEMP
jgi:hypothetical protein